MVSKRVGMIFIIFWCVIYFGWTHKVDAEDITGPKLSVPEDVWDFGTIKQGESVKHVLKLENIGAAELIIQKVRTTCGCTAAMLSNSKIPPGHVGELEVTFNSSGRRGDIQKSVYIHSNDVRQPYKRLKIVGYVKAPPKTDKPDIVIRPHIWNLGTVPAATSVSHTFMISNMGGRPLTIQRIKTPASCNANLLPNQNIPPDSIAQLQVTYLLPQKRGEFQEVIYIESSDFARPRVELMIVGELKTVNQPEISITPIEINFGIHKQMKGAIQKFSVQNLGDVDLIITKISTSEGFSVEPSSVSHIPPGVEAQFRVLILKKMSVGPMRGVVYINSNDPLEPNKEIRISGYKWKQEAVMQGVSKTNPVRMLIFQVEDCEDCEYIKNYLLPQLEKKYNLSLETKYLEITEKENYDMLVHLEEKYHDEGNDLPVVFIGDHVLGGMDEIKKELDNVVGYYVSYGGCDWPAISEFGIRNSEFGIQKSWGKIYLAMFDKVGCQNCARVEYILTNLKRRYPGLVIKKFLNSRREDVLVHEAMCELMHVPKDKRLIAPTIFIGDDYLIKDEITDSKLDSLVKKYMDAGKPPPWQAAMQIKSKAKDRIINRFKSLGIFAVIGAGLVDGINPCAFTTIIFFISYLALIGRKGKEILMIGSAFTISVFLTYFFMGFGAFNFIESLTGFSFISRMFYFLIAALALIFGLFSLYDYYKFKQGKTEDMKLQLPKILKSRIHKVIRENVRMRNFMLAAFVTGCLVSLLELACTGQMYLPTIAFVTGVPELRINAIFLLAIYNVMFVLPLIFIFIFGFYGTTSQQLGKVLQKHLGQVKILTGLFFFGLGILLIFTFV